MGAFSNALMATAGWFRGIGENSKARQMANALELALTSSSAITGASPIGSIVAWTSHIAGTPAIPANWRSCDGSAINNVLSPMNGSNLPDLNAGGKFLRGGGTSGTQQLADTLIPSHVHDLGSHTHTAGTLIAPDHDHGVGPSTSTPANGIAVAGTCAAIGAFGSGFHTFGASNLAGTLWSSGAAGTNQIGGSTAAAAGNTGAYTNGSETRPINMSVIWIMRIY